MTRPGDLTEATSSGSNGASGGEGTPHDRLAPYAVLSGGYALGLGLFLVAWRKKLPEEIKPLDLAVIGIATHKTSRALAKDKVTAPLRAPFTEYEEDGGPGEIEESPKGSGFRHAVGELLVCPYCLDQWVATGYAAGLAVAPRATRFVAGVMATVAVSDFLQIAYKAGEEKL